jgi:hypothetical protein
MTLDTGRLNSNDVLGFNFPKEQHVDYRQVTTCAPITQSGFLTIHTLNSSLSRIPLNYSRELETYVYEYKYGPLFGPGSQGLNNTAAFDTMTMNRTDTYHVL